MAFSNATSKWLLMNDGCLKALDKKRDSTNEVCAITTYYQWLNLYWDIRWNQILVHYHFLNQDSILMSQAVLALLAHIVQFSAARKFNMEAPSILLEIVHLHIKLLLRVLQSHARQLQILNQPLVMLNFNFPAGFQLLELHH